MTEPKVAALLKRAFSTVAVAALLLAQSPLEGLSQPLAKNFAEKRLGAQRSAMWALGAWAGVSILSGIGLSAQSDNVTLRYLGFQNIGWGAVNAAIAGFALFGLGAQVAALDAMNAGGDALLKELSEEHTFSKILLVNAGLDVGYMLAGGALMWAARNGLARSDEFFGSGLGVVIQGAFLLIFDIWQAIASGHRATDLENALRPMLSIAPASIPFGTGVALSVSF